jgi:hypothetical protein
MPENPLVQAQITAAPPAPVEAPPAVSEPAADRGVTIFQFPKTFTKAVQIGVDYKGTRNELHGCIEDTRSVQKTFAKLGIRFLESKLLTDDTHESLPTRQGILDAIRWLVTDTKAGDKLFLQYSGHGSQQASTDKYEKDRKDETLCPLDMETAGMITDNEINELLCLAPEGVSLFFLSDCCHSGTNCDLPFQLGRKKYNAAAPSQQMPAAYYPQPVPPRPQTYQQPPPRPQPYYYNGAPYYTSATYPSYSSYYNYYNGGRNTEGASRGLGSLILTTFVSLAGMVYERYISKRLSLLGKPLVVPRGGEEILEVSQVRPVNVRARVVSLSGCDDYETSQEFNGHGAMTTSFLALLEELTKNKSCITINQFIAEMYSELTHQGTPQLPQICSSFKFSASDSISF